MRQQHECEACQLADRGYMLYFCKTLDISFLDTYAAAAAAHEWRQVDEGMYWMTESLFYDMMDYLLAHYEEDDVRAMPAGPLDSPFDPSSMRPIQAFRGEREASWVDDVIRTRSLLTYYQPILARKNNRMEIIGYELLTRGIDPDGHIISPFHLFEAARLRNRLFALDRACRLEAVKNSTCIGTDQMVFINFLPTAIYNPEHCLASTCRMIEQAGLRPEQIVFEIVESDEIKNVEHLKSILRYYQRQGFKYALDDVGTGYNSLRLLSELEPDVVKLAMEFANGISSDPAKQRTAKAILELSRELNAKPLAEGVESATDFHFLCEMGYELFQGYYFGKPAAKPLLALPPTFIHPTG
ncbi:EAL domain-containing protein [Aneurinibacillus sp. REN35]|uniref:EAL domain-containing protein n=1 Tax=Aneurinibacillus sp. REN35 TaxID=3237286 RepID=UPI0035279CB1